MRSIETRGVPIPLPTTTTTTTTIFTDTAPLHHHHYYFNTRIEIMVLGTIDRGARTRRKHRGGSKYSSCICRHTASNTYAAPTNLRQRCNVGYLIPTKVTHKNNAGLGWVCLSPGRVVPFTCYGSSEFLNFL